MNCIVAVEGTVKSILHQWHQLCVENRLEDSEYARNVKSVIEGTRLYLEANPEVVDDPKLLTDVLYAYSRDLWLSCQFAPEDQASGKTASPDQETLAYRTYFYDFLYNRGIYPR